MKKACVKAEQIWVAKAFLKLLIAAALGIMVFRFWYWVDNCVINRIYSYPPVYKCGVHPFNFSDSYIDMRQHNREMSKWVKAGTDGDDFPPYRQNKPPSASSVDELIED